MPDPDPESGWFLYVLRCGDDSLYTGITTDLDRRVQQHNDGVGARCTRSRRPVRLVYWEPHPDRASASRREYQVKHLSRAAKEQLVLNSRD